MESAVVRTFETTELLEAILLAVPGNGVTFFPLQAVSKAFKAGIAGSIRLRRRMCLDHEEQPAGSQQAAQQKSHNIAYNAPHTLSFLPLRHQNKFCCFKIECGPFLPYTSNVEYKHGTVRYEVFFQPMSMGDEDYEIPLGMGNTKSQRSAKGSWRELKLTKYSVPVFLGVTAGSFREVMRFSAGEGTVGDFVDLMDRVRKEHKERRDSLRIDSRLYYTPE